MKLTWSSYGQRMVRSTIPISSRYDDPAHDQHSCAWTYERVRILESRKRLKLRVVRPLFFENALWNSTSTRQDVLLSSHKACHLSLLSGTAAAADGVVVTLSWLVKIQLRSKGYVSAGWIENAQKYRSSLRLDNPSVFSTVAALTMGDSP